MIDLDCLGLKMAYFTALTGFLGGSALVYLLQKHSRRLKGILMGFAGGALLAFVCFELLPSAFEGDGYYYAIAGMLAGVFLTVLLEHIILVLANHSSESSCLKTIILLCMGIAIHMLPEGMSIGSMTALDKSAAMQLCIVIALHCIPEGMTLALTMKGEGFSIIKAVLCMVVLSIPMGIGGFLGYSIGEFHGQQPIVSFAFAFAGGVMLYITCGEIIPQSRQTWNGRLTTLGAFGGFLMGIMLIMKVS